MLERIGLKEMQRIAPAPFYELRLPVNLREIDFGPAFNQSLKNISFPPSIEKLSFGEMFAHPLADLAVLPKLLSLTLDCQSDAPTRGWKLPSTLRRLYCGEFISMPRHFCSSFSELVLPSSLVQLTMRNVKEHLSSLALPESLEKLDFVYTRRFTADVTTTTMTTSGSALPPLRLPVHLHTLAIEWQVQEACNPPLAGTIFVLDADALAVPLPSTLRRVAATVPAHRVDAWKQLPIPIRCTRKIERVEESNPEPGPEWLQA